MENNNLNEAAEFIAKEMIKVKPGAGLNELLKDIPDYLTVHNIDIALLFRIVNVLSRLEQEKREALN